MCFYIFVRMFEVLLYTFSLFFTSQQLNIESSNHVLFQHFEDLVMGHFLGRGHDILVACKAYMDGAQVGCLVKGGVQDVDEGDKSCSKHFKDSLVNFMNTLVDVFSRIGVEDCEKFRPPTVNVNGLVGSVSQNAPVTPWI